MLWCFARRALCGAALFALLAPISAHADEATGMVSGSATGMVSGSVTSLDGKPVAGARIALDGPSRGIAASGPDGRYSLAGLAPGTYSAAVSASRFSSPAIATIDVRAGSTTSLNFSLARSDSSLTTIGHTVTNGRETVSTSSTPVTTINAQTYADDGYTRVSDVLQNDESTTLVHAAGGGGTVLPTSVAIRGPDPTETLVDVDGHQINNGNTGDFDLSLLDPADYSSIELVRGISPSSLVGPDTIDGAINIRTIEPTVDPHGLLRFNYGSYGGFANTLQTTGTVDGRLGYVFSLHRQGTQGEVNENVFDVGSDSVQHVGSGMLGSTALAKLRYAFGAAGAGYAELSFHDQSAFRDLSAGLTTYASPSGLDPNLPQVNSAAGTALQSHNAGYGLDVSVPLGSTGATGVAATTVLFRHYTSIVNESVYGPGAEQSPYLYNSRDLLDDESLQLDHRIGNGALTLQYVVRNESLTTDFISGVVNDQAIVRPTGLDDGIVSDSLRPRDGDTPDSGSGTVTLPLGQTQRSLALRYTYNPTPALHFTAAGYYSQLSLFGNYLDPRFGFVFTPDSRTAVRVSAGTTFQSPQLPELVVPNPLPAAAGNFISIGNPNLKPDQATEYGLGFDRVIQGGANPTAVSVDLYRVNLRQPASVLNVTAQANCISPPPSPSIPACPFSYPVNAGDGVYQGIELSLRHNVGPATFLRAGWAVRSAYLTSVPAEIQDGTLVVGEQTAGLPLHKVSISLTTAPPVGLSYGFNVVAESLYNELNQPPFATLDANIGYRFRGGYEIGLTATNLTNVYDERFTTPNGGVLYGSLPGPNGPGQPIQQDAYALQGTAFSFTLLRRF